MPRARIAANRMVVNWGLCPSFLWGYCVTRGISNPQQHCIILSILLRRSRARGGQGHFSGSFSLSCRREPAYSIHPLHRGLCHWALVLILAFLLQAHHPDGGQVLGPQPPRLLLVTQE